MSLRRIAACIKRNNRFLITAHTNPEGDALGSELALYMLLKAMGKDVTIVNEDSLPYGYDFLPGVSNIRKFKRNIRNIKFDWIFVLDCSDIRRCGQVMQINKKNRPIINIDHHISNERFGCLNWVESDSSCCAEMIYKLYKKLRIPLNKDIAMLLYVGISTDTGSFHYSNTSYFTHIVAAELLRYGLDTVWIHNNLYGNVLYRDMKLLIKILSTIKRQASGRIAWFQIKSGLLRNRRMSFDLTENILSFARAIKGVEVAVLFKENLGVENEIRVNLRSQAKVDVNKIAQSFGGGGHKAASGCTIKGSLAQVRRRVLAKIRQVLK